MKLLISFLSMMKIEIKYLLIAITLLIAPLGLKAGKESRNSRLSGTALVNGAYVEAFDDKFTGSASWISGFTPNSGAAKVQLGINEDLHVLHSSYFKTRITFDVELTDALLNPPVILTNQQLEIDYNPGAATKYTDLAELTWGGYYRVRVTNIFIQTWDIANNLISNPTDLFLEADVTSEKTYDFVYGSTTMGSYGYYPPGVDNELEVYWDYVPGAEEYELEWTYVDDYSVTTFKSPGIIEYDLITDGTRIITSNQFYKIPLTYEHGYIVYRIRPIGRNATTGVRLDGAWIGAPSSGLVSAATTTDRYQITAPLGSDNFNWSSLKTFAEDGKQGIGVNYRDGLMFNRQSIARLNTEGKSIVQGTLYDYYARPAVNLLPAPVLGKNFNYYPNLNITFIGSKNFDKTVFDANCPAECSIPSSTILDENLSVGAAKYYSASNPDKLGLKGYVPKANGIPYYQNRYYNDPLNRVAASTMPGLTHAFGTNHELQFLYVPAPFVEIQRLFGAESGAAPYYWKNYTFDPNGQTSTNYIDQYGRTIATALVGDEPPGIDAIPDKGSLQVLTQNLHELNYVDATNYCLTVNTDIAVTYPNEQHTFQYQTTLGQFQNTDCTPMLCFDCVYDLEMSIIMCDDEMLDHDNDPITPPQKLEILIGKQPPYEPVTCETFTVPTGPISTAKIKVTGFQLWSTPVTISFPQKGKYTITKKLCVSDAPINDYVNAFLNNPGCTNARCEFLTELQSKTDFSGCGFDCSECITLISSGGTGGPGSDPTERTPAETLKLIEQCKLFCPDAMSPCDNIKKIMLNDFKPGGQFAQTSPSDPNWTYSIFNPGNMLGYATTNINYAWNNPPTPAYGLNPSPSAGVSDYYKDAGGNYSSPAPEGMTDIQFISGFQNSWAEAFLPLHPDYCKHKFYCEVIGSSLAYDQKMKAIDNWDDACAQGFIDPIDVTVTYGTPPTFGYSPPTICKNTSITPPNYDPLFQNPLITNVGVTAVNTFYTDLTNVGSTGFSIYEQAALAGKGLTAPGTLASTKAAYLSSHTLGSDLCIKDDEWFHFKQMYQSYKSNLYLAMYTSFSAVTGNASPCIEPPPGYNSMISFDTGGEVAAEFGLSGPPSTSWSSAASTATFANCTTACATYSTAWIADLSANCTYASLPLIKQQELIRDLIAVCALGCDATHQYGASTLPTGTTYQIPLTSVICTSFQDVYNHYFLTTVSGPNCSVASLPFPAPYNYTSSGGSGPFLSNCNCDKILGVDFDFNTTSYVPPPGITTGRKLFKYRYGFDLTNYNFLVCACKGVLSPGPWAPGYAWSTSEINTLINKNLVVNPQLTCDECLSCAQVVTAVNNIAASKGVTVIDYAFFLTNSQTILNTINYANNTSFDMVSILNLYNECSANNSTTAPFIVKTGLMPYASALELLLSDWAQSKKLINDHTMNVCDDSKYFLSTLYSGPLPAIPVHTYQKVITGNQLVINLLDASSALIGSITLNLPTSALFTWAQVTKIDNLRGYAVQPATPGNNFGFLVEVTDGTNVVDADGTNTNWPIFKLSSTSPPQPMICEEPEPVNENECRKDLLNQLLGQAKTLFDQYQAAQIAKFIDDYKSSCFTDMQETFTRQYELKEYHYTLFYYDQAGNLVRTVAPKGVDILGSFITYPYPQHAFYSVAHDPVQQNFVTEHKYNSFNQPVSENSVDGNKTIYFYDLTGRVVASQNARQKNILAYSYSLYDAIGRIIEIGEVKNSTVGSGLLSEAIAEDPLVFLNFVSSGARTEVTKTYYDEVRFSNVLFTNALNELRNRIASITYMENYNTNDNIYDYATHYNYDAHGNVTEVIQEFPELDNLPNQRYKRVTYNYDLISGNINTVAYQEGVPDQFFHKYCYDADNRLHEAYTSRDGSIWDKDGKYFYYEHGPVARMEKGQRKVEGCDYFYTLQGWIKGINSNNNGANTDPGKDGNSQSAYSTMVQGIHAYIARDAASYSLNYYNTVTENDYSAIKSFGATTTGALTGDFNPIADVTNINTGTVYNLNNDGPNLFNGNIKSMVTTITNMGQNNAPFSQKYLPQISAYRYDQLQRIKQQKTFRDINLTGNSWNAPSTANYDDSYFMAMQYDKNGNIESMKRNGVAPTTKAGSQLLMDDMKYFYPNTSGLPAPPFSGPVWSFNSNRLSIVVDYVADNNYDVDIDDETGAPGGTGTASVDNYDYNEIGNMFIDKSEAIKAIVWSVDRKVKRVLRSGIPKTLSTGAYYPPDMEYHYDVSRRRVLKIEKPWNQSTGTLMSQLNWRYTYYVYDATGNVMATYTRKFTPVAGPANTYRDEFILNDRHIYGSSRLGVNNDDKQITYHDFTANLTNVPFNYDRGGTLFTMNETLFTNITYNGNSVFNENNNYNTSIAGSKQYEITNHLGNVITTISDRKLQVPNTGNTAVDYYNADVISTSDYYAFGQDMPGRNYNYLIYKYGFNGKENDKENNAGMQNFGMRMYDNRLGRFFARDPMAPLIFNKSNYSFAGNSPIMFIDHNGGFEISPETAKEFPRLNNMLITISNMVNSPGAISNPIIRDLAVAAGIDITTPDGWRKMKYTLSYGSGPIVTVDKNMLDKSGETAPAPFKNPWDIRLSGVEAVGYEDGTHKEVINDKILGPIKGISKKNNTQENAAIELMVFFTLMHEGGHFMDIVWGPNNSNGSFGGPELGVDPLGFDIIDRLFEACIFPTINAGTRAQGNILDASNFLPLIAPNNPNNKRAQTNVAPIGVLTPRTIHDFFNSFTKNVKPNTNFKGKRVLDGDFVNFNNTLRTIIFMTTGIDTSPQPVRAPDPSDD